MVRLPDPLEPTCRAWDNSPVEEMLGNHGVTESNMMQYLGMIEQRTTEILHCYATSRQMAQAGETQVSRTFVMPVCIQLSREEYYCTRSGINAGMLLLLKEHGNVLSRKGSDLTWPCSIRTRYS